jgi:hypothetical protein
MFAVVSPKILPSDKMASLLIKKYIDQLCKPDLDYPSVSTLSFGLSLTLF